MRASSRTFRRPLCQFEHEVAFVRLRARVPDFLSHFPVPYNSLECSSSRKEPFHDSRKLSDCFIWGMRENGVWSRPTTKTGQSGSDMNACLLSVSRVGQNGNCETRRLSGGGSGKQVDNCGARNAKRWNAASRDECNLDDFP
jgi:hypothetical protein